MFSLLIWGQAVEGLPFKVQVFLDMFEISHPFLYKNYSTDLTSKRGVRPGVTGQNVTGTINRFALSPGLYSSGIMHPRTESPQVYASQDKYSGFQASVPRRIRYPRRESSGIRIEYIESTLQQNFNREKTHNKTAKKPKPKFNKDIIICKRSHTGQFVVKRPNNQTQELDSPPEARLSPSLPCANCRCTCRKSCTCRRGKFQCSIRTLSTVFQAHKNKMDCRHKSRYKRKPNASQIDGKQVAIRPWTRRSTYSI